jgi:hypothetical protein
VTFRQEENEIVGKARGRALCHWTILGFSYERLKLAQLLGQLGVFPTGGL